MIANHGYLTLNEDNKLILDPAHAAEDEGIVYMIDGTKTDLFEMYANVDYFVKWFGYDRSLLESLADTTIREPRNDLETYSIGYRILDAVGSCEELSINHEFDDRFGCEVMFVCIYYKSSERWMSYVAITPQGIFVFKYDEFGSGDTSMIGHRVKDDEDLYHVLHHNIAFTDVFDFRCVHVNHPEALTDVFDFRCVHVNHPEALTDVTIMTIDE